MKMLQVVVCLLLVAVTSQVFAASKYTVSSPKKSAKYYDDQSVYATGKGVKGGYCQSGFGYYNYYGVAINESNKHLHVSYSGYWYCSHEPVDTWTYTEYENHYTHEISYLPKSWCSVVGYDKKKTHKHVISGLYVCPHDEEEEEEENF